MRYKARIKLIIYCQIQLALRPLSIIISEVSVHINIAKVQRISTFSCFSDRCACTYSDSQSVLDLDLGGEEAEYLLALKQHRMTVWVSVEEYSICLRAVFDCFF